MLLGGTDEEQATMFILMKKNVNINYITFVFVVFCKDIIWQYSNFYFVQIMFANTVRNINDLLIKHWQKKNITQ